MTIVEAIELLENSQYQISASSIIKAEYRIRPGEMGFWLISAGVGKIEEGVYAVGNYIVDPMTQEIDVDFEFDKDGEPNPMFYWQENQK